MRINFWDCPHGDCEEYWDGEDKGRAYMCSHPDGGGSCDLENKWCGKTAECPLLSRKQSRKK